MGENRIVNQIKTVWQGFKSIRSKNAILIICISIIYTYCNNIQGGLRGLVATREIGLAPTIVGVAASVGMIAQVLARTPSGEYADKARDKLKIFLFIGIILELVDIFALCLIDGEAGYYFVNIFDGVIDTFVTTLISVIFALSIEKEALGTCFAVMTCLQKVLTASGRQIAISIYDSKGLLSSLIVAIILLFIACCMTLMIDKSKVTVYDGLNDKKNNRKFGILWYVLPFSLACNMASITSTFDKNFMPLYADTYKLNYLDVSTLGNIVSGFETLLIGILCDFINPAFLIVIAISMLSLSFVGMAVVQNIQIFRLSYFVYYLFNYIPTVGKILGMKIVSKNDQGAFNGTYGLCTSGLSIFFTSFVGICIDAFNYPNTMIVLALWEVLSLLLFVITYFKNIKQLINNN